MSDANPAEATHGNGLDSSPASAPEAEQGGQPAAAEQQTQNQPNWQKRHDRLQSDYQPLKSWTDQGYTPGRIAELMGTFQNILKEPTLAKAITGYVATGKLEMPAAEKPPEEDPYEDPSVKALRTQVQELTQQLGYIRGAAQQTATVTAGERVAGLNEKFLASYPELTQEESQEFMAQLMPRMDQMIQGNPGAFQRLDSDTFEAIALPVLNKVAPLRGLGLRSRDAATAATRQHATDAPLRVATTGTESPARQPAQRVTEKSVRDGYRAAFREALRRTGRLTE